MMALLTKGPINEDVLPMMVKREKNRNSWPRGVTDEIMICEYEYHWHTKRP